MNHYFKLVPCDAQEVTNTPYVLVSDERFSQLQLQPDFSYYTAQGNVGVFDLSKLIENTLGPKKSLPAPPKTHNIGIAKKA